ncbi:MAG: glutathione S-transferase family protein [Pseudomonadota bacterium]
MNDTASGPESASGDAYRLIGAEESPYSVKVRACLRYKSLPHQWLTRAQAPALFQEHARLPLIPLLVTPDGRGLQDSTPIIEALEADHPEPAIHPVDPVCRFVSELIEEFADEWGNKWMFHYRWAREADQRACSRRLAMLMLPDANAKQLDETANTIRERMVDRVWFVGSSEQTAQQIEESFRDSLDLLEPHLAVRPYLFGGRPAFADFALWGQLYNAFRDPTPNGLIRARAPHVAEWIERLHEPVAEGPFEGWHSLRRSLEPLLTDQLAGLFLPWSTANARAIAEGEEEFTVRLRSGRWTQKPQKYHARSLADLQTRFARTAADEELHELLERTGILPFLKQAEA